MKDFLLCAKLCKWAQQIQKTNNKQISIENLETIESVDNENERYLIAISDENLYIVIRETELINIKDWLINLDHSFAEINNLKGCEVNSKFLNDALKLEDEIFDIIGNYSDKKIYITGFSSGAVISSILTLLLLQQGFNIEKCITFGTLRHVNVKYAEILQNNFKDIFHRVINNNDVICRTPERTKDYDHYGERHYFTNDNQYNLGRNAWEQFLKNTIGKVKDIDQYEAEDFADHSIDNYIKNMENLIN